MNQPKIASKVNEALTPEQKMEAAQRYGAGEGSPGIARILGTSAPTVIKAVRQMGVTVRDSSKCQQKHSLNTDAFDRLRNGVIPEDAAYWIGFLMADGCVSGKMVALVLAIKDREHVAKLKAFLKCTQPIQELPARVMPHLPKWKTVYKPYQEQAQVRLHIWSKSLADSLRRYGVCDRKSYGTRVVGLEFNRHFWRGVIDGDGCLVRKSVRGPRPGRPASTWRPCAIRLYGSRPLLEQFSIFVRRHAPDCKATVLYDGPSTVVVVNGSYAVCLLQLLYRRCAVSLDRKMKLAKQIIADSRSR